MALSEQTRLLFLVGPTATGKTAVAVDLCEKIHGEIVGADSVQVYRGLNIGSAKPTPEMLRGIRHHMIDVADPDQPLDAAAFARLAEGAIEQVISRGAAPVVVGGTGLWIRALIRGLVKVPPVDRELRAKLQREWLELGPAAMHKRLSEVDPRSAARIHVNDQTRVVRALEVYEQCGRPVGELRAEHALGSPRYRTLVFNLDIPRELLNERLRLRTRRMIEAGWADEVRALVKKYGPGVRSLRSVGYRQMLNHVVDSEPLEVTEQKIAIATRQYARRQRTWFQSDPDIDATMTPEEVLSDATLERIEEFMSNSGSKRRGK